MRVIFTENVKGTGNKGEVKDISDGYARNFLLPKKLAVKATEENINHLKEQQKRVLEKEKKLLDEAEEVKQKLSELTLSFTTKVGKEGKVFGSVTAKQIAEELGRQGFTINKKQVMLSDPIKALGVTKVEVKVHPKVMSSVSVHVKEGK